VGGAVLPDDHVIETMRARDLFHLAETSGGYLHGITSLFEPPDDGREEVCVRRVVQVDPDAHFAFRENHNPTGAAKLPLKSCSRARARSIHACPHRM
jgi:hypothetical protein